jgi:hypothetical protein
MFFYTMAEAVRGRKAGERALLQFHHRKCREWKQPYPELPISFPFIFSSSILFFTKGKFKIRMGCTGGWEKTTLGILL